MQRRTFLAQTLTFGCAPLGLATCPWGEASQAATPPDPSRFTVVDRVDPLELQFGWGILPYIIPDMGSEFLNRIVELRVQLRRAGICMPIVRARDNCDLPKREYRILVHGSTVFTGGLPPHRKYRKPWAMLAHLEAVVRSHASELSV